MRAALVLAGALAAAFATVALGDETEGTEGGVVYRFDSAAIGPPQSVVIDVSCPGRKHASGSGFGTVSTTAGPLNRSLPIDRGDRDRQPDDGWIVTRTDEPGAPVGTSFVHVMCDSKQRAYQSAVRRIADGAAKTVKARCGRSQHVSGGGAVLLGAPIHGEIESTYPFDGGDRGRKPDDGWAIRASNLDHQPQRLKVVAVCASAGLKYRSESAPLLGGGYHGISPECGDQHLIGMGARIRSSSESSRLENLDPVDGVSDSDSAPDDYAIGDGSSEAADGTMTVFGICR